MKPWRDVFSADTLRGFRKDTKSVNDTGAKIKLFSGRKTPDAELKDLENALRDYHLLDKRSSRMLHMRLDMLLNIHILASQWFTHYKIDRNQVKAQAKTVIDPNAASLNRNILTLERRSLRKRDYLEKLINYCGTANPELLLQYINTPRNDDDELLDLSNGVRMEREDFVHRDGYEDHNALMHQAFEQWAQGNHQIPFFLWLEGHEVCVGEVKDSQQVNTTMVQYFDGTTQVDPRAKFRIVSGSPLTSDGEIFDSDRVGYYPGGEKCIDPENNKWATGVAAFVWTAQNELFLCDHAPGTFHHSSLQSGQRVKSAGMIRIKNGLIIEMSSNSGHYKPKIQNVVMFIDYFRPVMTNSCYLAFNRGGGQAWRGTLAKFLAERDDVVRSMQA